MGLDTTHEAFHGAYSAFNRFRKAVLESIGGSYPPHENKELMDGYWYWSKDDNSQSKFSSETHKGLLEFLAHSDCDGEISPKMCKIVADELEEILPYIEEYEKKHEAYGHIYRNGGYLQTTVDFIDGCRLAHKRNEPLEFR